MRMRKTNNPHFAWDSYRRFVQMYGDVVLGMKPVSKTDVDPFEAIIEKVKEESGVVLDKDLSVEDLKKLVKLFKAAVKERTGQDFPTSAMDQLWGAICAVFGSWKRPRAAKAAASRSWRILINSFRAILNSCMMGKLDVFS